MWAVLLLAPLTLLLQVELHLHEEPRGTHHSAATNISWGWLAGRETWISSHLPPQPTLASSHLVNRARTSNITPLTDPTVTAPTTTTTSPLSSEEEATAATGGESQASHTTITSTTTTTSTGAVLVGNRGVPLYGPEWVLGSVAGVSTRHPNPQRSTLAHKQRQT